MLSKQIENHKDSILQTLSDAEEKSKEVVAPVYIESCEKLKVLWSKLLSSLEERTAELENCREQWLCFSYELEQIMNDLADGEREFSKSKSKSHLDIMSIEEEIVKNKVSLDEIFKGLFKPFYLGNPTP